MAKEITITDDKFIEISAKITNEMTASPLEYLKIGLVFSSVAAELFKDEEEKEEEKEDEFSTLLEKDVDDMKYYICTGGSVCKDDFVLMKETLPGAKVVYTRRFKTLNDAMSALIDEIL